MLSKLYWMLEVIIISFGIWLTHYSRQRMGLYRHFYFHFNQAQAGILNISSHWMFYMLGILLIGMAVWAWLNTDKSIQFCYRFSWRIHWLIIGMIGVTLIGILAFLNDASRMITLPYFIFGLLALGSVNLIGCLLIYFFHPADNLCKDSEGGTSCQLP